MKAKEFIIEYKKDRKAPKYSLKPRSPVAHAAQSVVSGSGPHKDKKKAEKQGDVKHKNKQYAEDAVADFLARGGEIQHGKFRKPRKSEKTDYGSKHIGGQRDAVAGKAGKTLGRAAATNFKGGGKPVVGSSYRGEGVRDLGYDAQSLIMKLRRDVEEKRLQPTRDAVLMAARELAGDMDFAPELLVRQVLGQRAAEEGVGSKLASLGLAGAMAFGAAGANARVSGDQDPGVNRLTGKPIAAQQATDNAPAKAEAPKGFSKEYLQSVVDGKHPRPMVSVEKAQQLLKQMNQDVKETSKIPFAGTKVGHKEGPAGQWRNDGPKKNKPAKPGDLVGGGM